MSYEASGQTSRQVRESEDQTCVKEYVRAFIRKANWQRHIKKGYCQRSTEISYVEAAASVNEHSTKMFGVRCNTLLL